MLQPIKKKSTVFVVTCAHIRNNAHYQVHEFTFGGYREPAYKGGPDCSILRGTAKLVMPLWSKQVFRTRGEADTELARLRLVGE